MGRLSQTEAAATTQITLNDAGDHLLPSGRVFVVDACRTGSPDRFIVRSDELLTAFLELEEQLHRAG
jgi:hypothetical protein